MAKLAIMTGRQSLHGSRRRKAAAAVFAACTVVATCLAAPPASARDDPQFRAWVEKLWPSASRAGVSRRTFDRAFRGVSPDPDVLSRAASQLEFTRPLWEYLDITVSPSRVEAGRAKLAEHRRLLDRLEARYGVDGTALLAVWGMESAYGFKLGDKPVIRSLATLAYRGKRRRFGRTQLIAALQILERGDISADRMMGSWAGAMGHTQFIPTSYKAYAVDFDGDGRRDVWGNVGDALASTANYLKRSGWRSDQPCVEEVRLPQGFDYANARLNTARSADTWARAGVTRVDGKLMAGSASVLVWAPAGHGGPAFAVWRTNFRAVLAYNRSNLYAFAVCHLASRIGGDGPPTREWPLPSEQLAELQRLLNARGFNAGEPDGRIGPRTRAALAAFQKRHGLAADGYPTAAMLDRLRKSGG